jgi:hypothetical protein
MTELGRPGDYVRLAVTGNPRVQARDNYAGRHFQPRIVLTYGSTARVEAAKRDSTLQGCRPSLEDQGKHMSHHYLNGAAFSDAVYVSDQLFHDRAWCLVPLELP